MLVELRQVLQKIGELSYVRSSYMHYETKRIWVQTEL